MNNDAFNRAQSNYDAMTPADRREPTDEDIRLYAEHIKPKMLESTEDAGELLSMEVGGIWWERFAVAIQAGYAHSAIWYGRQMLEKASADEAERIASDELYGDADHSETLRRIGADDWRTFFAKLDKERKA